jgi:phosphinothricin acetyltransferase
LSREDVVTSGKHREVSSQQFFETSSMKLSADIASKISIRAACQADADAIRHIYNYYVETSTSTFDTEAQPLEARQEWLDHHLKEGLPVMVAELSGQVVGWASLSYYHSRCAYRSSIEPSVYVHHEYLGKGIGRTLLTQLISQAQKNGYHCLVGLICSENTSSLQLLGSLGFETVGELKEVGQKFNRWLNVTLMQKML